MKLINLKKNEKLLWILFFITTLILSFRKILFNPSLMFGHNWDYSFPEVSELGSNIINLSIYSWNNFRTWF